MTHTDIFNIMKGKIHMEKDEENGWMDITFELENINIDDEEEDE